MVVESKISPVMFHDQEAYIVSIDNNAIGIIFDKDLAKWFGEHVKYQLNLCVIQNGEATELAVDQDVVHLANDVQNLSQCQGAELDGKEPI